jgi:hypothetical protein
MNRSANDMTNNRRSFLAVGLAFAAAWLLVTAGLGLAQDPAKQEAAQDPVV